MCALEKKGLEFIYRIRRWFLSRGVSKSWWNYAYYGSPPWDIDEPQPEIVRLIEDKEILGENVLDIGCGLGVNDIFISKKGFSVTGLDFAPKAIERARAKAFNEKVKIDFIVGDALKLENYFAKYSFATVIDSGLFHTLSDDKRPIFANQIWKVLMDKGRFFVLCFSDKQSGNLGPRRISKREIVDTFSRFFSINYIKDTIFLTRTNKKGEKAYVVSMTKILKT